MIRGIVQTRGYQFEEQYEYSAYIAQQKYEYNKTDERPTMKLDQNINLVKNIEYQILKEKNSPEVIVIELLIYGFKTSICENTNKANCK